MAATFTFEGQQRTVSEIRATMLSHHVVMSDSAIRKRLAKGEATVNELRRRPNPKINARWNAKGAS